jgi:pSer/pThr/pTyr-binding forkhead associated (FHA) protein
MFRLSVVGGVDSGPDVFDVDGRKTVGRLPGCPKRLPGVTVSKEHCTVEVVLGKYVLVRDLGSLNGTFVDRKRVVGEARAYPGSEINVGTFSLLVEDRPTDGAYQAVTPVRFRLHRS